MRTYSVNPSPFDLSFNVLGSQVQGVVWSGTKWVACALAGGGSSFKGNDGRTITAFSSDGVSWSSGNSVSYTFPADIADVVWSNFYARFYEAGQPSPATANGEWVSSLGTTLWTAVARATTATFETAICVAPAGALYSGNVVVGGELDSGTGRLIASGHSITGPWTARSTPIDDQPFRVAQIAYDFTFDVFVAALVPIGAVGVAERIMISADGGTTWTMSSSPLDGAAAYGVCWSSFTRGVFATGIGSVVFSNSGDGAGSWTQFNAPLGVHTGGKPCQANTTLVVPGGDTNDLSELDLNAFTFQSTQLTYMTYAKVAGYQPAAGLTPETVVVGGLGSAAIPPGFFSPTGAIYVGAAAPAADVPSLWQHFDLG